MKLPSSHYQHRQGISLNVSVAFVLCQGFSFVSFSAFVNALNGLSNSYGDSYDIKVSWSVLGDADEHIESSCGIKVLPRNGFRDPSEYDLIVVIGGEHASGFSINSGAENFILMGDKKNISLVGVASGRYILAELDLLDGKKCAVNSWCESKFKSFFPKIETIPTPSYILDNHIATCPGMGGINSLARALLAKHFGRVDSRFPQEDGADGLDYDSVTENTVAPSASSANKAIEYMKNNLSMPIPVKCLAIKLDITVSQLNNIFYEHTGMTPSSYWRNMRLKRAHWLLSNTQNKITDIALECGYYDSAHFNKTFKSAFLVTPKEIRS